MLPVDVIRVCCVTLFLSFRIARHSSSLISHCIYAQKRPVADYAIILSLDIPMGVFQQCQCVAVSDSYNSPSMLQSNRI